MSLKIAITLVLSFGLISCTEESKKAKVPALDAYSKETDLILKITGKLAREPSAQKLHDVSVATQSSRVVNCFDFNGECDQYRQFISAAIKASEDGDVTSGERAELVKRHQTLKASISEGKIKIRKKKN